MKHLFLILYIAIFGLNACKSDYSQKNQSIVPNVPVIRERFTTERNEKDNVDSPAIWQGSEGQNWLLATAKESNKVIVYDASTGRKITEFGQFGDTIGALSRPNGIAVIDNLALVVERDNHRIQVFRLPDFKPLGFFAENHLIKPYGLSVDSFDGAYHIYVTDNYETKDEQTPPTKDLDKRVQHYTFSISGDSLVAKHIRSFGDTSGQGVLYKVESILLDREMNRLLIADEHELQCNVKVYDINGQFTGQIIPNKYFFYEPEGIVVRTGADESTGVYIIVDQGKINNTFQVFDRSTLTYIGGFAGKITRNTDGICLTQNSFGDFEQGAFYPVHDDGSVTAISWTDISIVLSLGY